MYEYDIDWPMDPVPDTAYAVPAPSEGHKAHSALKSRKR